jgi:transcriptional regulator with XRE-family HTH domain
MSLGKIIAEARKAAHLSQRSLAMRIRHENGRSVSVDYIRDLEHDRGRSPSAYVLDQLATVLIIDRYLLYYWAGRIPEEIRKLPAEANLVTAAFNFLRKMIRNR